jgi:hypothetical protein
MGRSPGAAQSLAGQVFVDQHLVERHTRHAVRQHPVREGLASESGIGIALPRVP